MRTANCLGFLSLLAVFTSCGTNQQPPARAQAGTFFVATNGNDAWSGTIAASRGRNDGPFRTPARALQAAIDLKQHQGGASNQPVTIFIGGGEHFLSEPIVITPEHSGTLAAPLVITAYPGEHPVLSAGQRITDWQAVTIEGRELWVAEAPEAREAGSFFRQVWVNGRRRTRARHPNTGYLAVTGLPDATARWQDGQKRFQFKAGDLKEWKTAGEGDVVVMNRWVESRLPIISIDEDERLLTSSKRSVFQLAPGDLYYVEHVFDLLDHPGEWFLDREQGALYYQPLPGETLHGFSVIAPRLTDCVRIEGQPEDGRFVEHVQFRGLTFSHNEWFFPSNDGSRPEREFFGFTQAASGVPGIVNAVGARDVSFAHCRFANVGSYGLQLGRGCQSNRVSACDFLDLGGGGIKIGETTLRTNALEQAHGNEIVDCHIGEGGKMFHSAIGVWVGQSHGNRIAHNLIHDFYYTGISIGWTWGYGASMASNNIVEFNHVHHIGGKAGGDGPILGDMGGIYTLGAQPGTIIRNNLFHDVAGRTFAWGIYLDEGTSQVLAENNVVLRTTHGGFHQHYGRENIVRNNVFAFGRDQQLFRTRAEGHRSFTFERNIVYYDRGNLLAGDWAGGTLVQNRNVYFDARTNGASSLNFPGGWEAWRMKGLDGDSRIADPRFVTTNLARFELEQDSPALRLGFQPFELNRAGPRRAEPQLKEGSGGH